MILSQHTRNGRDDRQMDEPSLTCGDISIMKWKTVVAATNNESQVTVVMNGWPMKVCMKVWKYGGSFRDFCPSSWVSVTDLASSASRALLSSSSFLRRLRSSFVNFFFFSFLPAWESKTSIKGSKDLQTNACTCSNCFVFFILTSSVIRVCIVHPFVMINKLNETELIYDQS